MMKHDLKIEDLRAFRQLSKEDKVRCYGELEKEQLEPWQLEHKYVKRTDQIATDSNLDLAGAECFMCFDEFPLHGTYSSLIFSLCGISNSFYRVLYLNIMDGDKQQDRPQFICSLLANLLHSDMPKLTNISLKFIMCRDNETNRRVLHLFAKIKKGNIPPANTFLFINDPNDLRYTQLHDPYVQMTYTEIMQNIITERNISDVFRVCELHANHNANITLRRFISDFYSLSRDLLKSNTAVNLSQCTMSRNEVFQQIVMQHLSNFEPAAKFSRMFLFDLMRVLIIIYNF